MAVGLTIGNGQRSEWSRYSDLDYSLLKVLFRTIYTIELECVQY